MTVTLEPGKQEHKCVTPTNFQFACMGVCATLAARGTTRSLGDAPRSLVYPFACPPSRSHARRSLAGSMSRVPHLGGAGASVIAG